jgi:hypothetical protein
VNEDRLRRLLRDAPIPGERQAEERGLRIVAGAFERRPTAPRLRLRPRLAIALAVAALLLALILSPAGAGVRDWIGDVLQPGVENAEPALTGLPGGGRLLVESGQGPWVVQADGSRRLLGDYREATWSAHGLFVAVASGQTLSAVEPDGDPHWSLSRPDPITAVRWAPSGYRIAYVSGGGLRVVAGDGTGDHPVLRSVAGAPPAWRPGPGNVLAVARTPFDIRILDVDSGRRLGDYRTPERVTALEWSADGRRLFVSSSRSVKILGRDLSLAGRWDAAAIKRVGALAPAPAGHAFAVIAHRSAAFGSPRSEVLVGADDARVRSVFSGPGTFTDLAWSPDGRRLLVAWRDADQWLFIPLRGKSVIAVGKISEQFSPGDDRAAFPRFGVSGWCCPR